MKKHNKVMTDEIIEMVAYYRDAIKPGEFIKHQTGIPTNNINMIIYNCQTLFPYWRDIRKRVLRSGGVVV